MTLNIVHKSSVATSGGSATAPAAGDLEYGEIAVNYASADPAIFVKNSANAIIRVNEGDGTITTAKISGSAVTSAKIATGAVTNTKLANSSVRTDSIQNLAVTTTKIDDNAVTNNKIASNAVESVQIRDANVTSAKINSNAIDESKIQNLSITTTKINNLAVTSGKIADDAIGNSKLDFVNSDGRFYIKGTNSDERPLWIGRDLSTGNYTGGDHSVRINSSSTGTSYTEIYGRNSTNDSFIFRGRVGDVDRIRIAADGDVTNTNNSYSAISDQKLKENIADAPSQWDDVKATKVRHFNFKQKTGFSTERQIGWVAQEVELVSPGCVKAETDRDNDGKLMETSTKSVKTSVLLIKGYKALQEAMERIEALEAKIEALENPAEE